MKIRKLRLVGFKSFVEPAELRIEPGLTGVVGPNGCGKSNLLEAMRWAMGEASPRSLRGGGMEDVIFAGTTRRPPRDFAEVAILAERDGSEIEVVRRIERGAGSAYRIDGRDVRQKDVALLFADAATGAHSPALVSQNRIGAVIAAKPAERRQMLEDAAGIAGLHVRRRDAEQKLRATESNLERLSTVLADLEARAASLGRQARAAERYRALTDLIRSAEARLIWSRWRDAKAAADLAHAAAREAEAAVAIAGDAQRDAATVQAMSVEQAAAARKAGEQARASAAALAHRLATLTAERDAAVARLAELSRQRALMTADRGREDQLATDAARAIAALAEEERSVGEALAAARREQPALQAGLHDAEIAARDADLTLAQAQGRQASELADMRVAASTLAAARERSRRAEGEHQALARETVRLGDAAPLLKAREAARAAGLEAARAQAGATERLAAAEDARDAASAARDEASAARSAAAAELAALEAEARALDRALAVGAGATRRALDQLSVEPGFERALAAALGDDLDAGVGTGARAWTGASVEPGDAPLASGLSPLAKHVTGPIELSRRLAQIGVAAEDEGQSLRPGQRLVTREGRLRRWDGFVASDVGAAAAERLVRVNRRAALDALLPQAREAVAAASAEAQATAAALASAAEAIATARRELAEAEETARRAVRAEDQADAALDRLASDRAAMDRRGERIGAELEAARAAVAEASSAMATLPDGEQTRVAVEALRSASSAARDALTDTRTKGAAIAGAVEANRKRQEAVRGEVRNWRARAGDAARRVDEMARREAALATEADALADRPDELARTVGQVTVERRAAEGAVAAACTGESEADAALRRAEAAARNAGEAVAAAREARAAATARAEAEDSRRVEMGRISGERFGCPAAVLPAKVGFDGSAVGTVADESRELERLAANRERIGPVNLVAAAELAETEATHATLAGERDELTHAVQGLRGSIGQLNREGRRRLQDAFEAVDRHFRRLFTTLFAGGEAHLALVDSDDPLEAGLEIMAQPPGKRLAALTLLSGGEQALTAVALIFALFLTNPAPICVLDEVDAPLDDANVERFCDLLDRMVAETDTRYLIVTHNAVTMARMHRLFGVTMVEHGVSRLVSVDLGGAETLLAAE